MSQTAKRISITLFLVTLLGGLCLYVSSVPKGMLISQEESPKGIEKEVIVSFPSRETSVSVEVADTSEKRTLGLGDRIALLSGHGMLFVFETSDRYGFWMKDMHFALDMIWLDEDLKIVHIEKNVVPGSYPQIFKPEVPALYVLEVPAGFSEDHGLVLGDAASIETK